ncbi:hypothetical protein [Rhodococcus sp. X156]|uniref:Rv0361 family membrane protein n=1 Tax=Rhodococcus sp. X156 TaxID=2499145 RepID=UPI000FDACB1A|nr:hypothetical protein [Rhodococcus sp. X156]
MTYPQQHAPQPGGTPYPAPGTPQAPRRRTGLLAGIAAAVVVVIALVVVLVVTLGGDDESSASAAAAPSATASPSASPRAVGDAFMDGVATQDIPKVRSVACEKNRDELAGEQGAKLPAEYKIDKFATSFVSEKETSATEHELSYTAEIALTYQGEQRSSTVPFTLSVVKEADAWKVCALKS